MKMNFKEPSIPDLFPNDILAVNRHATLLGGVMPAQGRPGHHDAVGSSAPLREPLRKLGEAERPDLNRRHPSGCRDIKIGREKVEPQILFSN
jgi:hypothetical protein